MQNDIRDKDEYVNPMQGKKVIFVGDSSESENADGVCGHLEAVGESDGKRSLYDRFWKRGIDIVLSALGFVILSPVFLIISIAVFVDDPGPIFFSQKRIGLNKRYIRIHKFRTMKMSTPHDVPTHMLSDPEQYITRVGRFLRKTSLDGNVIIGQTTESLVNKGFREVSPIHFFKGRDLFSQYYNDFHAGGEGVLVA